MSSRRSSVRENGRRRDVLIDSNSVSTMTDRSGANSRTQSPDAAIRRSTSSSALSKSRIEPPKVQCWVGLTRSVHHWDGLRRVSSVEN
jgi:hypothetical protein